jgi:hypothetical protein
LRYTRASYGLKQQKGSAEFFILFAQGKAQDVQHISGAESLRSARGELSHAPFRVPFADNGSEKIVRRGILSCSTYTTPNCTFVFLLPSNAKK